MVAVCPPAPTALNQDYKKPAGAGPVPLTLAITGLKPLVFEVTALPYNGNLTTINPDTFKALYTPNADYCSLSNTPENAYFRVTDRYGQSAEEAAVSINIVCPPPPVAFEQDVTVPAGETTAFKLNSTGTPPLSLDFEPPLYGDTQQTANTTGNVPSVDYTPNYDFCSRSGEPDTFRYTVLDAYGQEASATVTLQVTCPTPPTATDQYFNATAGGNVTIRLNYTAGSRVLTFEESQPAINGYLPTGVRVVFLLFAC